MLSAPAFGFHDSLKKKYNGKNWSKDSALGGGRTKWGPNPISQLHAVCHREKNLSILESAPVGKGDSINKGCCMY